MGKICVGENKIQYEKTEELYRVCNNEESNCTEVYTQGRKLALILLLTGYLVNICFDTELFLL